jgi:hypothetical protein
MPSFNQTHASKEKLEHQTDRLQAPSADNAKSGFFYTIDNCRKE